VYVWPVTWGCFLQLGQGLPIQRDVYELPFPRHRRRPLLLSGGGGSNTTNPAIVVGQQISRGGRRLQGGGIWGATGRHRSPAPTTTARGVLPTGGARRTQQAGRWHRLELRRLI
jgi:hypothetical protein